jgi:DNA mismatch endonuclease (patch repair protein)
MLAALGCRSAGAYRCRPTQLARHPDLRSALWRIGGGHPNPHRGSARPRELRPSPPGQRVMESVDCDCFLRARERILDRLSRERRSALMARVRSKHTKPEVAVRRLVRELGADYRLHDRTLPGHPDLVVAQAGKIIFVHGCFWHGHRRCRYGRLPKSRRTYWRPKIESNRLRDVQNRRTLRRLGWAILVILQCQLMNGDRVNHRLRAFLATPGCC